MGEINNQEKEKLPPTPCKTSGKQYSIVQREILKVQMHYSTPVRVPYLIGINLDIEILATDAGAYG